MVPKMTYFISTVAPFWHLFSGIDLSMHFGRPLAHFWLPLGSLWLPFGSLLVPFPLAPFWRPLAPFWFPFGSLWLPFCYFWLHFGSLWLLLRTLGFNFRVFWLNFLIFQVSSHLSPRFLPEFRKINWKRNDFSILNLSHPAIFSHPTSKKTRTRPTAPLIANKSPLAP